MKGLSNNAMHQTRREGAVASRPVVEARLAGDCECWADLGSSSGYAGYDS